MPRMPGVPYVVPKSWSSGRPGGPPRFIVIHYTAGAEGPQAAENGVAYDQRRTDGTSSHFYSDSSGIIQCVDTNDRAHTAKYYGNLWGIHIEQCGTQQTRAQWLDPVSRETIRNTAKIVAWAMKAHNIPLARLVGAQMRTGKGEGGHGDVTIGFPEDNGSHMDPDGNLTGSYPWDVLFADVRAIVDPPASGERVIVPQYVTVPKEVGGPDFLPDGFTASIDWWISAMYSHILGGERQARASVVAIGEVTKALTATNAKLDTLITLLTPPASPPPATK